jgi:hypothetical protein
MRSFGNSELDSLDPTNQVKCKKTARERLFAYIMLRQSNKTNSKLKTDLHDDFGKGQDNYPKTRSETLRLLDVHTKTSIATRVAPASEATTFAQRSGTKVRRAVTPDKKIRNMSRKLKHVGFARRKDMFRMTVPNSRLYRN